MSKKDLLKLVQGKEEIFIEDYILNGPGVLKETLELTDQQWLVIFDYLVFEHNLIFKTVNHSLEFFIDCYVRYGVTHIREILEIDDRKYDLIWEMVFDYLAISHSGLLTHVIENREKYVASLRARGGDFLRKSLDITKDKYQESWQEVLEFLLKAVCDDVFTESNYDHGLRAFALLLNCFREHGGIGGLNRPLMK